MEDSRTVRTPENVERVRQAMLWSPTRSVRRHSIDLGIGNRSIRDILQEALYFYPKKLVVLQWKLRDCEQNFNFAGQMNAIFEINFVNVAREETYLLDQSA